MPRIVCFTGTALWLLQAGISQFYLGSGDWASAAHCLVCAQHVVGDSFHIIRVCVHIPSFCVWRSEENGLGKREIEVASLF
jgi:hypothetical protein